ncbi:MAG: glutathione S-transferase family protein [Deltaproteobacteria bacterium]|nr:glutathione S-transferase family protein [Deltaproteobacteria bacterium]
MITLYHSPRTRSLRVLWLLEELGVPYELKTLTFAASDLKSDAYLRINPLGKVPAIQDGDVQMFESGAIVEYLIERHGNGRLAPPLGTPERAAYLQWLHFAEATAMPPISDLAQHTMFKPEAERLAAMVPDALARIQAWMQTLEAALAGRDFACGTVFTGADVMLGYSVLLTKWFQLIAAQHPNLAAYVERLEARPALQQALSA